MGYTRHNQYHEENVKANQTKPGESKYTAEGKSAGGLFTHGVTIVRADHRSTSTMVLDIDEFRVEKGGNPEKIKENQRLRFCDEGMVDKIILCDNKWREGERFSV